MKKSIQRNLGEKIYREALRHRSGFDLDIDDDIWDEIYDQIGEVAMEEFRKMRKVTQ